MKKLLRAIVVMLAIISCMAVLPVSAEEGDDSDMTVGIVVVGDNPDVTLEVDGDNPDIFLNGTNINDPTLIDNTIVNENPYNDLPIWGRISYNEQQMQDMADGLNMTMDGLANVITILNGQNNINSSLSEKINQLQDDYQNQVSLNLKLKQDSDSVTLDLQSQINVLTRRYNTAQLLIATLGFLLALLAGWAYFSTRRR